MEPFFTTRTRRISTGLGLALVRGVVGNAHGSIEIESQPGEGTTFRLVLPAAPMPHVRHASALAMGDSCVEHPHVQITAARDRQEIACVVLEDPRLAAYITSLLRSLRFEVVPTRDDAAPPRLLVLDGINGNDIEEFLRADVQRRALILHDAPQDYDNSAASQVMWLDKRPTPAAIRAALQQMVGALQEVHA